MNRYVSTALTLIGFVAASAPSLHAQAGKATIRACSLLTKEEVKRILPWKPMLDQFPVEEEPIGTTGSSCNYPSVMIQILPSSLSMLDVAKKKGGLERLNAIGDEAYFHTNPNGYAEVYAKTGKYLVTVQANANGKVDEVKPGAINLAKALVAKLR